LFKFFFNFLGRSDPLYCLKNKKIKFNNKKQIKIGATLTTTLLVARENAPKNKEKEKGKIKKI